VHPIVADRSEQDGADRFRLVVGEDAVSNLGFQELGEEAVGALREAFAGVGEQLRVPVAILEGDPDPVLSRVEQGERGLSETDRPASSTPLVTCCHTPPTA
jgi:hypothetical protein